MVASGSPTVLKRWIAFELRRLREQKNISREEAARAIHGSVPNMSHMEVGKRLPAPLVLKELLRLYGVPERTDFFLELRQQAKKGRDWWIGFVDTVPDYFNLFLGLESMARQIDAWDAHLVPGLFQTPDYARAVIEGGELDLPDREVDRRLALRLARQKAVLDDGDPPLVRRVISEAALLGRVGSAETMRFQLKYLLELSKRPNIEIWVLPLAVGAHTGTAGSFTLLSFPPQLDNDPGVVHVETYVKGYYYEEQEQIAKYRNALTRLRAQATAPADTPAFIRRIAKEL